MNSLSQGLVSDPQIMQSAPVFPKTEQCPWVSISATPTEFEVQALRPVSWKTLWNSALLIFPENGFGEVFS